jgi:hypothetical protein
MRHALLSFAICCVAASYNLDDPNADHANEAISRDEDGDTEGAMASFRAAARFNPSESEVWNNLGICLLDSGDQDVLPEAADCFSTAMKLDPSNSWARDNLQVARDRYVTLKRQQNFPDAFGTDLSDPSIIADRDLELISPLREAVRSDPESSEAWHELGLVLMAGEGMETEEPYRFLQAAWCFSQALHHDPKNWVEDLPGLPVPVTVAGCLGKEEAGNFEKALLDHSTLLDATTTTTATGSGGGGGGDSGGDSGGDNGASGKGVDAKPGSWLTELSGQRLLTITMSTEGHIPLLDNMLSSFRRTGSSLPPPLVFTLDEPTAEYWYVASRSTAMRG